MIRAGQLSHVLHTAHSRGGEELRTLARFSFVRCHEADAISKDVSPIHPRRTMCTSRARPASASFPPRTFSQQH